MTFYFSEDHGNRAAERRFKFNFIYNFKINNDYSWHFDGFASQYLYASNFDGGIFCFKFPCLYSNHSAQHFESLILNLNVGIFNKYWSIFSKNNIGCTFFVNLLVQTLKLSWKKIIRLLLIKEKKLAIISTIQVNGHLFCWGAWK